MVRAILPPLLLASSGLLAGRGLDGVPLAPKPWIEIRLLTHITSYGSPPGTPIRAIVVRGQGVDPGVLVHGVVRRSSRVGFGLIRERASLALAFTELEFAGGRRVPIESTVRSIDNAREEVVRAAGNGSRIRGVLAAATPGGWVRGLWLRPRQNLLTRAALGFTGAAGTISSKLSLPPLAAGGLLVAQTAWYRMPEPEIHLSPGAEMNLEIRSLADLRAPRPLPPSADAPIDGPALSLAQLPHTTWKPTGRRAADIINVAFRGSREEIAAAFAAAGWFPAEPLTRASFTRSYRALVEMRGYPTAPVSVLLYQGGRPQMVFQKSFNTIAKRHHIRIWHMPSDSTGGNPETWVAAATHDTGIAFHTRRLALTHRIDPRIDLEREKVIADLRFAGCLASTMQVERPHVAQTGRDSAIRTDGRIAAVNLASRCTPPSSASGPAPPVPSHHRRRVARLARRAVLETRNYLIRGNLYYFAYLGFGRLPGMLRDIQPLHAEPAATAPSLRKAISGPSRQAAGRFPS
jgi:hypothetical protein